MSPEKRTQIVERVVERYVRRCWWAERDDLLQVGHEAALRAAGTFDARVGVPEEGYTWRAVVFAVRAHLWRESAPVSGGGSDPWTRRRGLHRAPIERPRSHDDDRAGEPLLVSPLPDARALLDEKRWVERARERIDELTSDEACALGRLVLLGEKHPRDVARETGVRPCEVYASTDEVRRRLRYDRALWMMVRRKHHDSEEQEGYDEE